MSKTKTMLAAALLGRLPWSHGWVSASKSSANRKGSHGVTPVHDRLLCASYS